MSKKAAESKRLYRGDRSNTTAATRILRSMSKNVGSPNVKIQKGMKSPLNPRQQNQRLSTTSFTDMSAHSALGASGFSIRRAQSPSMTNSFAHLQHKKFSTRIASRCSCYFLLKDAKAMGMFCPEETYRFSGKATIIRKQAINGEYEFTPTEKKEIEGSYGQLALLNPKTGAIDNEIMDRIHYADLARVDYLPGSPYLVLHVFTDPESTARTSATLHGPEFSLIQFYIRFRNKKLVKEFAAHVIREVDNLAAGVDLAVAQMSDLTEMGAKQAFHFECMRRRIVDLCRISKPPGSGHLRFVQEKLVELLQEAGKHSEAAIWEENIYHQEEESEKLRRNTFEEQDDATELDDLELTSEFKTGLRAVQIEHLNSSGRQMRRKAIQRMRGLMEAESAQERIKVLEEGTVEFNSYFASICIGTQIGQSTGSPVSFDDTVSI